MKFRKILIEGDPALGRLELNLLKPGTNMPYNTVIFVGENGCGKSKLLMKLSKFIDYANHDTSFKEVEYEQRENIFLLEKRMLGNQEWNYEYILHNRITNIAQSLWHLEDDFPTDADPRRHLPINLFLYQERPSEYEDNIKSILRRMKVLHEKDCINYAYYNITHTDDQLSWADFYRRQSKMYRFSKVLNQFFDNLRYLGIITDSDEYISFTKFQEEINAWDLSSGEKQMIAHLIPILENMDEEQDNLLLVDEPELSLHPKWQAKIINFYKSLFVNADGVQCNQMFVATHSTHLLKAALQNPSDTLLIKLKNEAGHIEAANIQKPVFLHDITYAEINYIVFDIATPEYHNQLYCEIQNRFHKAKVKACDTFITSHESYDARIHRKISSYGNVNYETICTYIRNSIDHYENGNTFTEDELRCSITLMQNILRNHSN